jgi:hypothetical protein
MEDKKTFWETKIGKIIGGAKDILPNNGVLGVLKNLIDSDDSLSAEEKIEAQKHLQELYKAEVEDRDSARKREVEIAKAGKSDWMMMLTGVVGLLSFLFVIYAVVFIPEMNNNDLFIHLMGMIEGLVVGNIFAYYYGTSAKNKDS